MLPLGHGGFPQYWIITSERRINILFLWNLEARVGFKPAISDFQIRQGPAYRYADSTPRSNL